MQTATGKSSEKILLVAQAFRICLILFSFVCSFFYITHSLYNPEAVNDKLTSMIDSIETEYNQKIDTVRSTRERMIEDKVLLEKELMDSAKKKYDKIKPSAKNEDLIKQYRQEYIDAENAYIQAKAAAEKIVDKEIQDKVNKLEKEKQQKIGQVKINFEVESIGDNAFLKSSLLFLFSFGNNTDSTYSRGLYYIIVLLFALFVAGGLELSIYISQWLSSMSKVDLLLVLNTEDEREGAKFQSVLSICIAAIIMFAIFLIYGLLTELAMSKLEMLTAFVCLLMSVYARSKDFFGLKLAGNKEGEGLEKFRGYAITLICQILICVAGFVIVSIVMLNKTSNVASMSIALSIGNAGGQLLISDNQGIAV